LHAKKICPNCIPPLRGNVQITCRVPTSLSIMHDARCTYVHNLNFIFIYFIIACFTLQVLIFLNYLVDALKQVQCDVYVKMRSSNFNNRRREILDKEKIISLVMTEFKNNEINRIKYVEKLALPIVK
jgi:hypothetical protein